MWEDEALDELGADCLHLREQMALQKQCKGTQMTEKHKSSTVLFREDGFDIDEWDLKMEDPTYVKLILRILEEKDDGEGAVLEAKEMDEEVKRRIEMHGSVEKALSYRPN